MKRLHSTTALFLVAGFVLTSPALAFEGEIIWVSQFAVPNARDVWGYKDGSNYYALVGGDSGTRIYIIDVTDPFNPELVASRDFPAIDTKVWDHYAYGAAAPELSDVLNINNPAHPRSVGMPFSEAHNLAISQEKGLMFLSDCCMPEKPLQVMDVASDPENPILVWDSETGDGHDTTPRGNVLYDFSGGNGVDIWDITDVLGEWNESTQPVATVDHGGEQPPTGGYLGVYSHSGDVTPDHRFLFICDEVASQRPPGRTGDIYVWDITDVRNQSPVFVDSIADPDARVHNLYIVGGFAFVSYYTAGFKVIQITPNGQFHVSDEWDTSPQTGQIKEGAWGVYPFDERGLVYVSDKDNGLFVFGVDGYSGPPTTARVSGRITDSETGNGLDGVLIEMVEDGVGSTYTYTDGSGNFDVGVSWNWTGMFIPRSSDYEFSFELTQRPFADYWFGVTAELGGQDFAATRIPPSPPCKGCPPPAEPSSAAIPEKTALLGNFPNPFNPETQIAFALAEATDPVISIYDVRGTLVRREELGTLGPGIHEWMWGGRDSKGENLGSGVYFVVLKAGRVVEKRKLTLIK